ncbi:transposase [Pseudomonas sp. OIL-1]|uniref:REP-associated tyrosine transposase n=1 Tax=Pseudomonas sp. OIL-1 TaxID=2706126 RepID=UPI0013A7A21E|nr:transposase [Pseudomonas sp. OIL-1]QIB52663.1 transposase [Pseudomonas sp. OIL-1]
MNNLKRHASDLRIGRTSEPGRLYLVTTVTLNREPVFANLASARTLINTLRSELSRNQIQTWAYVVMPDHFHWLMQLNHEALSAVVGRVKGLTAKQLGQSIWQSGFHDRAVRKEDDLKAMARYIIANPLRAGIVESVANYPHWDAVWL